MFVAFSLIRVLASSYLLDGFRTVLGHEPHDKDVCSPKTASLRGVHSGNHAAD